MQSPAWYLRRLKSMDAPEIAWRVANLCRDQLDIIRIPLRLTPTLPERFSAPSHCDAGGFRCSPVAPEKWASLPEATREKWERRLIRKAAGILDNRLSYFDLIDCHHGDPWNWHRDFSAGIDCPVRLSNLTDYREFETYGDCKLVWEPNRHHQLVVLARAYVVSGDPKYAAKVAELLRSWIDANPFGYGMNWKSPLELGIRTINWIWALDLIRDAGAIDEALWLDVQRNLYLMIWDSQRKFSRGTSANNHLIGEVAGVFIGASYFEHFPNANKWRAKSQAILEREIFAQTFPDGCTREHAFGYAFFVLQFFSLAMIAGDRFGTPFSADFRERLHAMYRFMADLSSDTGHPPNSGDADDGYVLDLGELPDDPASLLAVGSALFDDPDLAAPQPSEWTYWLLGERTAGAAKPPQTSSQAYPDSGYFILRSDTDRESNRPRMSVFFDCAELGFGALAAHGHADCLSFCLSIDGTPILVDAGTYDYFTHPEWRNYFRTTRAHNTVEIDGVSQSESLGPFLWGRRAHATLLHWRDDAEQSTVTGKHDGYVHTNAQAVHHRTLTLSKSAHILTVTDRIEATGAFEAVSRFHCAPGCKVSVSGDTATISHGQCHVSMHAPGREISLAPERSTPSPGWVSDGYHSRHRSTCIEIAERFSGTAETSIEFSLLPKGS